MSPIAATASAVRMSCQTIAGWTARPVRSIPHDGRLALIADPDGRQRRRVRPGIAQGNADAGPDAFDDLVGIVLHPSRAGRDLAVLQLVAGDDPPAAIEQDAATARCSLIDRGDEAMGRVLRHADGVTNIDTMSVGR